MASQLSLPGMGFYTRGQLASILDVVPKTIELWEESYGLPVIKIGRKTVLYDIEEVKRWLRARGTRTRRAA
jgi:phage terminase Nu1 subunit (DNA packaging protein)